VIHSTSTAVRPDPGGQLQDWTITLVRGSGQTVPAAAQAQDRKAAIDLYGRIYEMRRTNLGLANERTVEVARHLIANLRDTGGDDQNRLAEKIEVEIRRAAPPSFDHVGVVVSWEPWPGMGGQLYPCFSAAVPF
jgi:hypothetical protein